eukprot:PhM_4_TR16459/c0_g1_i1/m.63899/K10843/ERCC3, XPB; DNA excision repair protein ERCC-3
MLRLNIRRPTTATAKSSAPAPTAAPAPSPDAAVAQQRHHQQSSMPSQIETAGGGNISTTNTHPPPLYLAIYTRNIDVVVSNNNNNNSTTVSTKNSDPDDVVSFRHEVVTQSETNYSIFLETFHPRYAEVLPFVSRIADPRSRTLRVHEYEITPDSLRGAVALGWSLDDIEQRLLEDYAATSPGPGRETLHERFRSYMRECVSGVARVKLVLSSRGSEGTQHEEANNDKNNNGNTDNSSLLQYQLESVNAAYLSTLLFDTSALSNCFLPPLRRRKIAAHESVDGLEGEVCVLDIRPGCVERVKKVAIEQYRVPLENHYDHKADDVTDSVENYTLRPVAKLRPYQIEAIGSVFAGSRARSGIVVLPCGAGKSLTGVAVASQVAKRTLVLCVNTVSVNQWKEQFLKWTNLRKDQVSVLTSESREVPSDVVITTYNQLVIADERRNQLARLIMEQMRKQPWGLVLFDEVHVAPAATFRTIVDRVRGHCLLGLTATLLREDDKIEDLHYLIGPKLYECSPHQLTTLGYLSSVVCVEVHTPLPPLFLRTYLSPTLSERDRSRIYNMNPTKLWCTQALMAYHESRDPPDKIIVFSESLAELEFYARMFGRPFLSGKTPPAEREHVIAHFKFGTKINTIFLSRVGDAALDIPDANVIIQISSFFGQRRAEVQRLGRILRPKTGTKAHQQAYFYSLITPDTKEHHYAIRRQRFLLDQGYGYKVVTAPKILSALSFPLKCVGFPVWQYLEASSGQFCELPRTDSLAVENAFLEARGSVNLQTGVLPLPTLDDLTPVTEPLRLSDVLIRGPDAHHHVCDEECLTWMLEYTLSEHFSRGLSYVSFCNDRLAELTFGALGLDAPESELQKQTQKGKRGGGRASTSASATAPPAGGGLKSFNKRQRQHKEEKRKMAKR